MRISHLIAATALAAVAGTAAVAENLLAKDPQSFINLFFDEGYPAQLTEDAIGDPLIEFRYNGEKYAMFFYDCVDNAECLAVQFYSGYQTDEPFSLEQINEWNSGERRFTRAYSSGEAVHIEMDIATSEDGVSERDFKQLLSLYLDRVVEFEEFIGW